MKDRKSTDPQGQACEFKHTSFENENRISSLRTYDSSIPTRTISIEYQNPQVGCSSNPGGGSGGRTGGRGGYFDFGDHPTRSSGRLVHGPDGRKKQIICMKSHENGKSSKLAREKKTCFLSTGFDTEFSGGSF